MHACDGFRVTSIAGEAKLQFYREAAFPLCSALIGFLLHHAIVVQVPHHAAAM